MTSEERLAHLSEAVYYVIAAGCAVVTTLMLAEHMGLHLMDRWRRWRAELDLQMKRESFEFFYANIWPSRRKARDAGQLDE